MTVDYGFVYELMRAYRGGNLLINKKVVGGKVKNFLEIPNSYRQVIYDENGNPQYFQYFEFSIPFHLKFLPTSFWRIRQKWWEKPLENFFKWIEKENFKNNLLPVTDEEIEKYNTYWGIDVFMAKECTYKNCASVYTPKGEVIHITTQRTGKRVPDVWELVLKPLGFFL